VERRIPRAVFTGIGALAACLGVYTLFLAAKSALEFLRLATPQSQAPATRLAGLILMGSVDLLAIAIFGIMTAFLFALAVWGLEPRQRWRNWRARARAT
jgi:hypothetical protein